MKNKLELMKVAAELAESLMTETSDRKIKSAILDRFNSLTLDDADYTAFEGQVYQLRATYQGLQNQQLETEKLRIAAEKKAAAPAA